MVSDDQIMKTQTCFLQEMVQKERIQPSTVDLFHLVPFCLSLIGVLALCGCCPLEKEWKSLKMANVNKNMSRQKNQKVP